jgi:hypothetical protein
VCGRVGGGGYGPGRAGGSVGLPKRLSRRLRAPLAHAAAPAPARPWRLRPPRALFDASGSTPMLAHIAWNCARNTGSCRISALCLNANSWGRRGGGGRVVGWGGVGWGGVGWGGVGWGALGRGNSRWAARALSAPERRSVSHAAGDADGTLPPRPHDARPPRPLAASSRPHLQLGAERLHLLLHLRGRGAPHLLPRRAVLLLRAPKEGGGGGGREGGWGVWARRVRRGFRAAAGRAPRRPAPSPRRAQSPPRPAAPRRTRACTSRCSPAMPGRRRMAAGHGRTPPAGRSGARRPARSAAGARSAAPRPAALPPCGSGLHAI